MKSTTRFKSNKKGTKCLNCDHSMLITDNFCPECGQVNDDNRISLKQYFSETLSGFFSFDNRLFRTLIPLIFRPGKVTKEYIEGKRMKYANPFQLFLHVTILFFLLQGIFQRVDEFKSLTRSKQNPGLAAEDSLKVANLAKDLGKIPVPFDKTAIKDSVPNTSDPLKVQDTISRDSVVLFRKEKIATYLDSAFANSNYYVLLKDPKYNAAQKDSIFEVAVYPHINYYLELLGSNGDVTVDEWKDISSLHEYKSFAVAHAQHLLNENKVYYTIPDKFKLSEDNIWLKEIVGEQLFTKMRAFMNYDKQNKDADIPTALQTLGYETTYWNAFYYTKAKNLNQFKDDPDYGSEFLNSLVSKISMALFFLLPVFTLLVSLFYIRGPHNYTEHLLHVFHVQTAFFIILGLLLIFDKIFNTGIGLGVFFIIFPYYLYRSLKNFYQQGWFKTTSKFIVLNILFLVLSSIGFIIISFISFLV